MSNWDETGGGHSWHYMRFCGVCGARPAELLPVNRPRCRLHGGRALRAGERLPSKPCTAPGFLDTRLRYAAWRSSYCSRASSGVRYASFSRRQH